MKTTRRTSTNKKAVRRNGATIPKGYSSDQEALTDYFLYIDLSKQNRTASVQKVKELLARLERLGILAPRVETTGKPDESAVSERLQIFLKAIHRRVQDTRSSDSLWLISKMKEHRLDIQECLIIAIVCHSHARGGELVSASDILDILSGGDRGRMMLLHRYIFDEKCPLLKCGLIRRMDNTSILDRNKFTITDDVRKRLFGVAGPAKQSPFLCIKGTGERLESPRQVYDHLTRHVIGQDHAARTLSVAVYNHYLRVSGKSGLSKTNILLAGPTGCGKTYLAEVIAKLVDVPLYIADATQYSETGYVGQDLGSVFQELYRVAGNDPIKAAGGIIYLDEIDKIARTWDDGNHYSQRDVSGESVQEELLKAMEAGGSRNWGYRTDNVLFIAGGAFAKLYAQKCEQKITIGFGQVAQKNTVQQPGLDDFVKFGMLPELMGRFQTVIHIEPLSPDDLVNILTGSKDSLIGQYKKLFAAHGMKLVVPVGSIRRIAEKAAALKTGARGLKTVLEQELMPHMFDGFGYQRKENNGVLRLKLIDA